MKTKLRIAVLDLYNNQPGEGMRCIAEIVQKTSQTYGLDLVYDVFDVRHKLEIADLSYDLYISSGGPGSPIESEGSQWEKLYFNLMDGILEHNKTYSQDKKQVFLICHSFQIFARYYELAQVKLRKSTSFGVFPVHRTRDGLKEELFGSLPSKFWVVDSRDWQVVQPNLDKLKLWGGKVVIREKYRPHIPLEQAIMAIRFNDQIFGTQFHPEADPMGMLRLLQREDKKQGFIKKYGEEKYDITLDHLDDEDKIVRTQNTVLPNFIKNTLLSRVKLQMV